MHSIVRCALFWLFLSNAVCLRGQSPPQKVHGGQPPDTTFASLSWRSIGPTQYSGRVDAIAVPRAGTPGVDRTGNVIYIAGAGGIWKTSNSGASWTPVFDNQPISEVRTLALAPSNQEVVWAGTGFFSHGIHGPVPGVGVFKSLDAGATWQAMGLAATEYVMRIAVQPGDSEVVLVAAQGPVTRASADRGIYRTADGGKSWTRVLFINEWTGAADVLFDPVDPKVAYAATWEYAQSDLGHVDGGPGSGIFKSTDGGLTWRRLGRGLPIGVLGKLQLAVASSQHDRVYAVVLQVAEHGGGPSFLYRSDDGGENWVKQCELRVSAYLQGLAVDPRNPDRVYIGDAFGAVSTDGGKTTKPLGDPTIEIRDLPRAPYDEIHDVHNIWVNPDTPNEVIICSDWGVAFSRDEGVTFQRFNNLPIPLVWFARPDHSGPFYRIHVAVRDNDTAAGPNRTRNRLGVVQSDWYPTLAGEDIDVVPNPSDPEVTYIYRHGGMVGGSNILRHDTRTGLLRILSPPVGPGDSVLNKRGCAVSVSRHSLLYCTSNDRLLISSDGGESWHQSAPFSLVPADEQPASLDGKTLIRYGGGGPYQAVTAVADSAVDSQVIYLSPAVGTVTVTRDGGKTWAQHKLGEDVPPRLISDIVTSPSQPGTAYITMPAPGNDDCRPYLFKTINYGTSWQSVAGDLPRDARVWMVAEHPRRPELLFVATDRGVFASWTGGEHWLSLRNNLPGASVRSIAIQPTENDLVAGVWGRGVWILDDLAALEHWTECEQEKVACLFPIRVIPLYVEHKYRDVAPFHGANPPYGASISYYLPRPLTPADDPELEVLDHSGRVIAVLAVDRTPGLHRLTWDLREQITPPKDVTAEVPSVLVPPGTFQVRLTLRRSAEQGNGERKTVAKQQITVEPDPGSGLSAADYIARYEYQIRIIRFNFAAAATVRLSNSLWQRALQSRASPTAADGTQPNPTNTLIQELRQLRRQLGLPVDEPNPNRTRVMDLQWFLSELRAVNGRDNEVPSRGFLQQLASAERVLEEINKALREVERQLTGP